MSARLSVAEMMALRKARLAASASLAASHRQATADYRATGGVEHITVEPPMWCHDCNRIVSGLGVIAPGAAQISVLCLACAAKRYPDRRHPAKQRVRELVEATRLLVWHAQDSATDHANRGCHETARVLRELAAAADNAIEALRTSPQET